MSLRAAPAADAVQVWRARLDVSEAILATLAPALSDQEKQRAQRYRLERDGRRFTAARGWLRRLLAGYTDVAPAALELTVDANGKPRLASPRHGWLRFNLSHSDELAVFVVARDREVGIDVELINADLATDEAADRVFTAAARQALAAVPTKHRVGAFFDLWTRQEALLKGVGVGFRATGAVSIDGWAVSRLDVGHRYAAAVAVHGSGVRVPAAAEALSLRPAD